MAQRNTVARTLHDVGLAAWFGGSLMGAAGLNKAASDIDDPRQRSRAVDAGWARWTPVNLAAIGVHLVGGAQLAWGNKARIGSQKGVAGMTTIKMMLTAGALGATAYSRVLGEKVMRAGDVPVGGGTTPVTTTPPQVASAQKQLQALQWAIPALTGGIIATSAYAGEQQRATQVARGIPHVVVSRAGKAGKLAAARATTGATRTAKAIKNVA